MLKNNLLIMTKFGFPKITLKTFASLATVVIVLLFTMLSCTVQSDVYMYTQLGKQNGWELKYFLEPVPDGVEAAAHG